MSLRIAVAPLVLLALVWTIRGTPLFDALVTEDGILEWLQVVCFAAAIVRLMQVRRRGHGRRRGPGRIDPFALAGALVLVVVVGEELAWGTRLADVSIDAIVGPNRQDEVTLHNLPGGLAMTFAGLALVSGAAALAIASGLIDRLVRVPSYLTAWFALPALYATARLAVGPIGYDAAKLSEVCELVFAASVLIAARAYGRSAQDALTASSSASGDQSSMVRSRR